MRPINLARLREPTFVQRKLTEMQKSRDANFSDIRSDNRSVSRTDLIVVLVSADLLLWYVVQKMIPKQKEGECTPGAGEKGRGWWKRTLVPERPGLKNSIWNQSGFWERVKGKERVMRMRRVRYEGTPRSA